jgi:hypothetical protein
MMRCIVGANSFAHKALNRRMNSHRSSSPTTGFRINRSIGTSSSTRIPFSQEGLSSNSGSSRNTGRCSVWSGVRNGEMRPVTLAFLVGIAMHLVDGHHVLGLR